MNKIDLNGRRAVVTGGAQGFGRAIAERFVASGADAIWITTCRLPSGPRRKRRSSHR
jgi:NAD(P)-dependent dehydrogenase (short-subunit alcohol dehydrogenase family)